MAPASIPSKPTVMMDGERYFIFADKSIGRGAYSEVYLGRTDSGKFVAVKTACKRIEIEAIRGEVQILKQLRGATNIVQYIGCVHEKMPPGSVPAEKFSFAMEYATSSLEAEMRRPENLKGLPADMLIDLVVDCSMALSALHQKNIAHRDIKHMNILLFPGTPTRGRRSSTIFKLCDMGCSKALLNDSSHEMRTLIGTENFLHPFLAIEMTDPRMARNQHDWKTKKAYTPEQCDLWSLGCTLYFCATGMFPFVYDLQNKKVYLNAAIALTLNPDAIGMSIGQKERDYVPITELPAKYTKYPKWLVCTMTCLIRQFFHDPSIEKYAEIANAMRTSKRRKFLSIDQLSIIDHTDMSNVPYVGYSIPSLSVCMGYPERTDMILLSNTSSQYFDSNRKTVVGLDDDFYLVVPQREQVDIRTIPARNIDWNESEDMHDRKLAEIRAKKCHDGLSMLKETDEYCELFDRVSKILSTQFSLLAAELSNFERIQTTSRFAVYMDMATVPMMLLDGANPETKTIAKQCSQQAVQAREELERHIKLAMDIEGLAKQLAKDSNEIRLNDTDVPGIREEFESYCIFEKADILATTNYSKVLVEQCFNRQKNVMKQIFNSPDGIKRPKLKHALDLAASLNRLRSDYLKLQNTISECVDLLERPFQEMKELVNRHLQQQGHSRVSMEKSMHLLAPEFQKDQQRVKVASVASKDLVNQLNRELEESIKELDFVRLGDTLIAANRRDETQEDSSPKTSPPCCAEGVPQEESTADISVESSSSNETVLSYTSTETYTTSFESTPPSSPANGSNYFQAVMQLFYKPPA